MTVALKLLNINKSYADVSALLDIKLEINDGEFFSLLGPSGSGKTTCLKVIAGFELPDTGQIELFGKDVSSIPPFKRDVNTVFQDYALFPHMNVKDNVAYSLKIKKTPLDQQEILINEILSTVKLIGYETRKPSELSGGQRQRVALARSLINKPKVLLLDEPLGALDLKLREQMQIELKNLQRQFQITFIYVTHDQQEAMSMSDRIAIFNEGRIEQIDTPKNIYNKPKSAFVADFIGTTSIISKKNALKFFNHPSAFSLRPEFVNIDQDNNCEFKVDAEISDIQYQGSYYKILFKNNDINITSFYYPNSNSNLNLELGSNHSLSWSANIITDLDE
ncbi:MAG: polyamine ABC transporter ATP-binding protein [Pelagibacteraceae bacterium TMED259]|jgi:putative spermidine/putrescine transport system ATP-binding protein|nr:MAG: polyamine ABC transporter ATP-binding protein [Pelagibacteraceae bacterium TMED259]|tara:strand:+ start:437 stop:1441 length:1005 start_codon:yes stop_codon:yes gene_type:complete